MSAINISKHAREKKKHLEEKDRALERAWQWKFLPLNKNIGSYRVGMRALFQTMRHFPCFTLYTSRQENRKRSHLENLLDPVSDRCCRIRCGNIVAPDPLLGDISRSREIHTFNHEENSIWSVSNYRSILYRDKVHKFRHETI